MRVLSDHSGSWVGTSSTPIEAQCTVWDDTFNASNNFLIFTIDNLYTSFILHLIDILDKLWLRERTSYSGNKYNLTSWPVLSLSPRTELCQGKGNRTLSCMVLELQKAQFDRFGVRFQGVCIFLCISKNISVIIYGLKYTYLQNDSDITRVRSWIGLG